MDDPKIEQLQKRVGLGIIHQWMSVAGIPVIMLVCGLYGRTILGHIDSLDAGAQLLATNMTDVLTTLARHDQRLTDDERRLAWLERNRGESPEENIEPSRPSRRYNYGKDSGADKPF